MELLYLKQKYSKNYSKFLFVFLPVMIIINSIILAADNPLGNPKSITQFYINQFDFALTIIFCFQMLLQIISHGFLFNSRPKETAYLRDPWNVLDFIVVLTSILNYSNIPEVDQIEGLKSIQSLRVLRTLKPLRLMKQYESLRILIISLFQTISLLQGLLIVTGIVMWIMAIILSSNWKDSLQYCQITESLLSSVNTRADCLNLGGKWVNSLFNYDVVPNSLLILLKIMIGENWISVLWITTDINGIDKSPILNNNPGFIYVFLLLLVLFNIFIFNMFVGMVINNFQRIKDRVCGITSLQQDQRDFVELQRYFVRRDLEIQIPWPRSSPARLCRKFTEHQYFEITVALCIIGNISLMGSLYRGISEDQLMMKNWVNRAFLAAFNLEILMKVFSLQSYFFVDSWNKFDAINLIICDAFFLYQYLYQEYGIVFCLPYVLRGLRLGKLLAKLLVDTVFILIPDFINIACLIFLLNFIMAILGMNLFAKTQINPLKETYPNFFGDKIYNQLNFQTFSSSLLLLFECSTGQMWDYFMMEYAESKYGCYDQDYEDITKNGPKGCGGWISYPFFIFIILIIRLIMMNLFLAVTVEGFITTLKISEAVIPPVVVDEIFEKWQEYDPKGTGMITPENLMFFLHEINFPLGFKGHTFILDKQQKEKDFIVHHQQKISISSNQFFNLVRLFNIPIYKNEFVHLMDVLQKFTQNAIIQRGSQENLEQKIKPYQYEEQIMQQNIIKKSQNCVFRIPQSEEVLQVLMRQWTNQFPVLKTFYTKTDQAQFTVLEFLAVKRINVVYNKQRERKRLKRKLKDHDILNKLKIDQQMLHNQTSENSKRKRREQESKEQKEARKLPESSLQNDLLKEEINDEKRKFGSREGILKSTLIETTREFASHNFSIQDSDLGIYNYQTLDVINNQNNSVNNMRYNTQFPVRVQVEKNQPNYQFNAPMSMKNVQSLRNIPISEIDTSNDLVSPTMLFKNQKQLDQNFERQTNSILNSQGDTYQNFLSSHTEQDENYYKYQFEQLDQEVIDNTNQTQVTKVSQKKDSQKAVQGQNNMQKDEKSDLGQDSLLEGTQQRKTQLRQNKSDVKNPLPLKDQTQSEPINKDYII